MSTTHRMSVGDMARAMSGLSDQYRRLAVARHEVLDALEVTPNDPHLQARRDRLTAAMVKASADQNTLAARYREAGGTLPFWPATKAA